MLFAYFFILWGRVSGQRHLPPDARTFYLSSFETESSSLRLNKLISQVTEDAILKIRRPVYKRLCKSRATYRPKRRCKLNLSTVSVLANRSLHQDLMHSGSRGRAVPNICPQAFTLSLSSRFFHPFPKQRASLQAHEGFTIFSLVYKYLLPCSRSITYKIHLF